MSAFYLEIQRLLRNLRRKALDASASLREGNTEAARRSGDYAKLDLVALQEKWAEQVPRALVGSGIPRHLHFGEQGDFADIVMHDIPRLEEALDEWLRLQADVPQSSSFRALLHPQVARHSLAQFDAGNLRDAVLNGFLAVFDLIRTRTALDLDGSVLIAEVT